MSLLDDQLKRLRELGNQIAKGTKPLKVMRDLTKGEITTIALEILASRNVNAWRQNNVRAVRGRTFTGRKGVPDIIGFNKSTGIFVGCEVKTKNDKIRSEQEVFLMQLSQAGGLALIAKQDKEGRVVLTEFINGD